MHLSHRGVITSCKHFPRLVHQSSLEQVCFGEGEEVQRVTMAPLREEDSQPKLNRSLPEVSQLQKRVFEFLSATDSL